MYINQVYFVITASLNVFLYFSSLYKSTRSLSFNVQEGQSTLNKARVSSDFVESFFHMENRIKMIKTCRYVSDLGAQLFCAFITLNERAALVVHEKKSLSGSIKSNLWENYKTFSFCYNVSLSPYLTHHSMQ